MFHRREIPDHEHHGQLGFFDPYFSGGAEIAAGSDPNDSNDIPAEVTNIRITETSLKDGIFTIRFVSTAGAAGWRIKGSIDLVTFNIDETPNTTVTETAPGNIGPKSM